MEPDENWDLPPTSGMEHMDAGPPSMDTTGLSKLERRKKRQQRGMAHSLVGTPNYIAPEVLLKTGKQRSCNCYNVLMRVFKFQK